MLNLKKQRYLKLRLIPQMKIPYKFIKSNSDETKNIDTSNFKCNWR